MSEEISTEIKDKCHRLCAQYLSGIWKSISRDDITYKRIIGGITNQMFYCALSSKVETIYGEPKEVALKLYRRNGRPLDDTDESIMNDIIVGLIISENGLGPKIYGISCDAVMMQFIKCHQFSAKDQKNHSIVRELGRKLAKIHSMKPPINRNINWFYVTFTDKHINAYKNDSIKELIKHTIDSQLNYFNKNDFQTEFKYLEKLIIECESPIVFSHNDFGFNNILVKDLSESNHTSDKIVLSDFEFSSYGFRGRDLGIVFDDWLNFNELEYHQNCDSIIKPFLKSYFDESVRIRGEVFLTEDKNSVNNLLSETKLFLLLQKMFTIVYNLNSKELVLNKNKLHVMKNLNHLFGNYLRLKNILIEEKVIKIRLLQDC